jgi:LuxR family maltose regulon positive regulatory protein
LPLAEAKLAAPRLRADLMERPRIARALESADSPPLVLVAAPVGFGKTTAVRAWTARREAPLAWVTVDAGENDPARLWRYVATAVNRVRDGLGRRALQLLAVPGAPIEGVVDELLNGIAAFNEELVIVLDDLQTITDEECVRSIGYALGHLPPTAQLVAITRVEPALQVAKLRSRGEMIELRADELAFTAEEAYELLVERAELDLDADEVALLCERTEGWPAALVLASLWLRRVDDPRGAVRDFAGDHSFVVGYLSQVVLDALSDDLRSFLLRASVLGRFTPELCDAVFERDDSAAVIGELERANLFIARHERVGWSRIHSLFAEFARFQLASVEPDVSADIHRRAAAWLRSRGLPFEAAEHAAAVGDDELIAQLLVEHHLSLLRSGGARTLLGWAETLPDEQLVAHPQLAVAAATAARMVGRRALASRRFLQLVGRAQEEHPERVDAYVRAAAGVVHAASVDEDVGSAVLNGRRAVEFAQAGADDVLVDALAAYARALYLAGSLDEAWSAAIRAIEHPDAERRAPGHAFARSTLALVACDRGRLGFARTHAEKAKAIVGGIGSNRSWLGANASVALGAVFAREGNLAAAERELSHAEHFFRDELATVQHTWLLVLLARVRCARGRIDEAETTLRSAHEAIAELPDTGRIPPLAAEVERELEEAKTRAGNGQVLRPPSEAELAVLRLLATDLSAREIGEKLYLSSNTVNSHTRAIYRKLGVNSRADAVARASAFGFIG